MALVATLVAMALPAAPAGCPHVHPSKVSYRTTTRILRNHTPLSPHEKRRVRHYKRCTPTRAKARAVRRHVQRLRRWRMSYEHLWHIRFNRMSAYDQQWAISTGACESGNNPTTATGNGFYGAHQWLPSTWAAADSTGMFVTDASYWHQAVVAVSWRYATSDEQWPVCGD